MKNHVFLAVVTLGLASTALAQNPPPQDPPGRNRPDWMIEHRVQRLETSDYQQSQQIQDLARRVMDLEIKVGGGGTLPPPVTSGTPVLFFGRSYQCQGTPMAIGRVDFNADMYTQCQTLNTRLVPSESSLTPLSVKIGGGNCFPIQASDVFGACLALTSETAVPANLLSPISVAFFYRSDCGSDEDNLSPQQIRFDQPLASQCTNLKENVAGRPIYPHSGMKIGNSECINTLNILGSSMRAKNICMNILTVLDKKTGR